MTELPPRFRCFLAEKDAAGAITRRIDSCSAEALPAGDVLIKVAYSSLNYKDALSATGHPGVTRKFPHVPGIDAAGTVIESNSPDWRSGNRVIVTGHELGVSHWGGYADYIRVPAEWIVALPDGLTLRESMILGTAGFTAAQSVAGLVDHGVAPDAGEVVVTGASGGVGSIAVAILSKLGYDVVAVSGKAQAREFLQRLGASEIVGRDVVDDRSGKPLLSSRWAGAVDTVGGNILSTILRSTKQDAFVTACGLVAGAEFSITVYPFILRGVSLLGIDSALCPMPQRLAIWSRLAGKWKPAALDQIAHEITLSDLDRFIGEILAGRVMGRTLVRVSE